jgi:hypothetical protein
MYFGQRLLGLRMALTGLHHWKESIVQTSVHNALPFKLHSDLNWNHFGPYCIKSWACTCPCTRAIHIANFGQILKCANIIPFGYK